VLRDEASVSTLARHQDMSFAAVQKHVTVLEHAHRVTDVPWPRADRVWRRHHHPHHPRGRTHARPPMTIVADLAAPLKRAWQVWVDLRQLER
jgi:hypothetical protein